MKNIEEEKREKRKNWQLLEGIFRVELISFFFFCLLLSWQINEKHFFR